MTVCRLPTGMCINVFVTCNVFSPSFCHWNRSAKLCNPFQSSWGALIGHTQSPMCFLNILWIDLQNWSCTPGFPTFKKCHISTYPYHLSLCAHPSPQDQKFLGCNVGLRGPDHPWPSLTIPDHPWPSLTIPDHPWQSLTIPDLLHQFARQH